MQRPKEISLAEVKLHNKPDDVWVIIRDKVYNLSKYLNEHPGGADVLQDVAGKNATKEFLEVGHSMDAEELMKQFYIGELTQADKSSTLDCKCIAIAAGAVIAGIATIFLVKKVIISSK